MNKWNEFDKTISQTKEPEFSPGELFGALTRTRAVDCAKPEYCKKPVLSDLQKTS